MKRIALISLLCCGVSAANAQIWNEIPDAGQTVTTAQNAGAVPGPLANIAGNLTTNDIDVYRIFIADPVHFSAEVISPTAFDTQLFLFRNNGAGTSFNDDLPTSSLSRVTGLGLIPGPGLYLLGISAYDRDPINSSGQEIWQDVPYATERPVDGPGAGNPIFTDWNGTTSSGGPYTIRLNGAGMVPEPATIVALSLGAMTLLARRRRK